MKKVVYVGGAVISGIAGVLLGLQFCNHPSVANAMYVIVCVVICGLLGGLARKAVDKIESGTDEESV